MILGILPALGSSLSDMEKHGQKERFVKYYLSPYARNFSKVYFFSYSNDNDSKVPSNSEIIIASKNLHRYLYGLFLPFLKLKYYSQCSIFRCFHISAAVPAIIGKIFFSKKFIFNYNYDYKEWAKIEGKAPLVPFIKILELIAFHFADRIFVSDQKMHDYVGKCTHKEKIDLIPNGVDPEIFKPLKKSSNSKSISILSIGRLEKQKNYSLLLEGLSLVKFPISLTIIGQGSEEISLNKLARDLKVPLTIIPVVPHLQLPKFYARADIYVQTSLIEAPVKTLLEAMSCELPVIGTNVPGIENVIDNGTNGMLIKSTPIDLADKVEELIKNKPLCKKIGMSAREKIISSYNLPRIVNQEIKILKNV